MTTLGALRKQLAEARTNEKALREKIGQMKTTLLLAENELSSVGNQVRTIERQIQATLPLTKNEAAMLDSIRGGEQVTQWVGSWRDSEPWRRADRTACTSTAESLIRKQKVRRGAKPGQTNLAMLVPVDPQPSEGTT